MNKLGVGMSKIIVKNLTRQHPDPLARKPRNRPRAPTRGTLTTDQVAHLRWLYEKENWTYERLSEEFGLSIPLLRKTMSYVTRSFVLPKKATDVKAVFEATEEIKPVKKKVAREEGWCQSMIKCKVGKVDYRKRFSELFTIAIAKRDSAK